MNEAIRKLKKVPFDLDKILEELQSNSGSGSSSEIKMFKKSIEASQLTNNDNGLYEATINHTLASEITSVLVKSTDTKETVDFSCIELNDNSVKIIIAESISIDVILLGKNSVVEDVNITSENIEFNADEFTANNVKAAIIENRTEIKNLKQFANSGKSRIASAIGTPLTESDTFEVMEEKINTLTSEFKSKLTKKGIEVVNTDKLLEMIRKVEDLVKVKLNISGEDKLPSWFDKNELIPDLNIEIEDMWINGSVMITKRDGLTSGTVDNKIYCIGGYNINYELNNNECYDTNSDTWTTKKEMITERRMLASSTIDNKIYCIGGYDGNYFNNNECYDTNSNTWTTKENMITKRYGLTSNTIDNKIYCIGGFNASYLNNNECYDTNSDIWTTKKEMITGRDSLTSNTINNKIYCIAGLISNGKYLDNNECYDTNSDTWTTKENMITKRYGLTSNTIDNKIYCIGGWNSDYLDNNECYDTKSDTWTTKKEMITKRESLTSNTINNKIYCIGGDNGNYLNNNEIYIP